MIFVSTEKTHDDLSGNAFSLTSRGRPRTWESEVAQSAEEIENSRANRIGHGKINLDLETLLQIKPHEFALSDSRNHAPVTIKVATTSRIVG